MNSTEQRSGAIAEHEVIAAVRWRFRIFKSITFTAVALSIALAAMSFAKDKPTHKGSISGSTETHDYRIGGVETGEGYLRECPAVRANMQFSEVLKANYCFGYVRGIIDYNRVLNTFPGMVDPKKDVAMTFSIFCPPNSLGSAEADALLRQYIERHPDQRSRATASLAARAFAEAYPCPAPNSAP